MLKEKDRSDRPVNNIRKKKKDKADTVAVPARDLVSTEPEPEAVEQDSEMEALNEEPTPSQPVASASSLLPTESTTSVVSEPGTPSAGGPSPTKKAKHGDAGLPPPPSDFYKTLLEERPWFTEGRKKEDFTVEACREVERKFWRGLGVGESAWYGADMQGTLFTDETKDWNVGKLPNLLNRLKLKKQLPGVNTPVSRSRPSRSTVPRADLWLVRGIARSTSTGACGGRASAGTSRTWISTGEHRVGCRSFLCLS